MPSYRLCIFQMENIDKQHEVVKKSLFKFVNTHISNADLSVVDEIVLNYVIAILEEASEDPNFDVDGKCQFSCSERFCYQMNTIWIYFWNAQICMVFFVNECEIFLGFVEMMSAYLPDFSQIETGKVYQWIVALENEMSNEKKTAADTNEMSIK